jgi:hypothetical protein
MNLPAVLALILVQLVGGEARDAETARRVVLFPIDDDAALHARLAAELRAQGFEPIEVSLPAEDGAPFGALLDSMRATRAERALRIERSPRSIRLWIANGSTGKQIYREAPSSPEREDAAIVSLWAVEALRASAVPAEPVAVAPAVVVAPAAAAPAPAPRGTLALRLAPSAIASPGGIGPSAQLLAGVSWLGTRHLGAELFLVLPAMPAHLERPAGSTDISIGLVGAGPVLAIGSGGAEARWSGQLAAGASAILVRVSGVGAADYLGKAEHVVVGGPYARAGLALRLSRALRLRGDGMAGMAFPQPVVYFADQRVADWGRPWLAGALGVEAVF